MYRILVNCFNPRSAHNVHHGFEEAGCDVKALFFDWDYEGKQELMDKHLIEAIDEFSPDLVFTYGWWDIGIDINRYLEIIKSRGLFHIYWAYDDPICFDTISMPIAIKSDLVFTSVDECIPDYRKKGINAHLLLHSCYPAVHRRINPVKEFQNEVVLLANNYNIYEDPEYFKYRIEGINNLVRPMVNNNFDFKAWGLWWLHKDRAYTIPEKFYGGILPADYEPFVYSSCKIALGLQSVGTSKTHFSMRTFEAMACKVLHVSQYSPALETFFKKGIHMEWSGSADETLEIVKFYLKREKARERIALKGQMEVYEKHTMLHRAQEALKVISEELK